MSSRKLQSTSLLALSSVSSKTLRNHETTTAEDYVWVMLILFLKERGFSGEVHHRAFICNPQGKARRPDFYIPSYALAIEIDGATRDTMESRQADLIPRDDFYYELLGTPPLVIQATSTVSANQMALLKSALGAYLEQEPILKRLQRRIAKRIHDGRKKFAKRLPRIFDATGTEAPAFSDELRVRGIKETRHFGGTKVILRKEYGSRAKRRQVEQETSSLDLSPEAIQRSVLASIERNRGTGKP